MARNIKTLNDTNLMPFQKLIDLAKCYVEWNFRAVLVCVLYTLVLRVHHAQDICSSATNKYYNSKYYNIYSRFFFMFTICHLPSEGDE